MAIRLNKEEKAAIKKLEDLAKVWPKTLWLFSGAGRLHVMKCGPKGERVYDKQFGGVDPDYSVATINISNDGGDW